VENVPTVDLIVLGLIVLLALRGVVRGLVREAFDIGALLLGTVVAFRLAAPAGRTLAAMSGLTVEVARVVAGLGLFVALSLVAAIGARLVQRSIRVVPGLGLLDRLGGAGVGALYGILLVTVTVTLVRALPMPAPVEETLRSSDVATALASPGGPAQRLLAAASGDRVPQMLMAIDDLVGQHALVLGGAGLPLGSWGASLARPDGEMAATVLELVNRRRTEAGVAPLDPSDGLAVAALLGAQDRYAGSAPSELSSRLRGVTVSTPAEVAVLAASPDGAVDVLMADPDAAATLLDPTVRRVGIAVVSGPVGNIVDLVVD